MRLKASHRLWLRTETRAEHDAVDARFGKLDLGDADGYRRFLLAHARALLPLETALEAAGVGGLLPDWHERRRSAALLADLGEIGASPPLRSAGPELDGDAAVIGALYVLEGSRLGAKLLARRVTSGPKRYLSHGEGRAFWPTFVAVLDGSAAVADRPDLALVGARAAFATFRDAI